MNPYNEETEQQKRKRLAREARKRIFDQMQERREKFEEKNKDELRSNKQQKTEKSCMLQSCERLASDVEKGIRGYIGDLMTQEEIYDYSQTIFLYVSDDERNPSLKCYNKTNFSNYLSSKTQHIETYNGYLNYCKIPIGDYIIIILEPLDINYKNNDIISLYKLTPNNGIAIRNNTSEYYREDLAFPMYNITKIDENTLRRYFTKCTDEEWERVSTYEVTDERGNLRKYKDFQLRYIKAPNGTQSWYKNGKYHRENGPAVIRHTGQQEWYKNNRLHRDNGPAIIRTDGRQEWYKDGLRHREDGPAIIRTDGYKEWYIDGHKRGVVDEDYQRLYDSQQRPHSYNDEPAIIQDGDKYWYKHGVLHRENGPAVINKYGSKQYFINGIPIKLYNENSESGAFWRSANLR